MHRISGWLKQCSRTFNNLPILIRLLSATLPVLVLMAALAFISFGYFFNDKTVSTINTINQSNQQAINKFDDYYSDMVNITKFPLNYKQNNTTYISELLDFNKSNQASLELQKMNEQIFNDIFGYKSFIQSVYMFNTKGTADYKSKIEVYRPLIPTLEEWFQECIDAFGKPVMIDTYAVPYTINHYKDPDATNQYVFAIARGIVRIEDAQVIGVLLVNTDIAYLRDICNDMIISSNQRILILHEDTIIYDTDEENISEQASSLLTDIQWDTIESYPTLNIDGEVYIASSLYSEITGWRLINLVSRDELFSNLNRLKQLYFIIVTVVILLSLGIVYLISRQIVNPIRRLAAMMHIAEKGNFKTKLTIDTKDEIGDLANSFNIMTDKIDSLIKEVYLNKISQVELELQLLQNQINPHFLYNTLESISMMATVNDDDTTAEMADALGSFLRYGISSKKQTMVSVREELDSLNDYILLQMIRFSDQYQIIVDVEPETYDNKLIRLILQPLVENAIYHGMSTLRSDGIIKVTGWLDGEYLYFTVTDNGCGMTPDRLLLLNDYINEKNHAFKSIGLINVHKRIKLSFGEGYGLNIESLEGKGTTITVILPNSKISPDDED